MSIPEIQSTEIELYLAKIAGKSVTLPETQNTRAEKFLAKIAGENVVIPIDQRTRLELFLAKWAGSSVNLPADAPINRIEHYLLYILGESETKPEHPHTKLELYLDSIETGSYETETGVDQIVITAVAGMIRSLIETGVCTQASTPTPSNPVDIVCNNGALKMLNLANMIAANLVIGKYISNTGSESTSPANFYYSPYIPVKAATAYTMALSTSFNYINFMEYKSDKSWNGRTLYGSAGSPAGISVTHTMAADTAYVRFGGNKDGNSLTVDDILAIEWMLTEGSSAMDYVPYGRLSAVGTAEVLTVSGSGNTQTASAPNKLSADSIADEYDFISGVLTHKVGVWVLTGEETWSSASSNTGVYYLSSNYFPEDYGIVSRFTPICSYLNGVLSTISVSNMTANTIKMNNASKIVYVCVGADYTRDEWKAFIAEQYAAGKPIIILYPLETETTEQTTPHSLNTITGTNVISASASVSNIPLSVTYKA